MYLETVFNSETHSEPDIAKHNFADADDPILVQACLAGAEEAWATLFQRYSRLIYKIPLSFGFPITEAEEIFQETAMEIVAGLADLRSHAHLHPWIVTIARRVCIRRLRSAPKYTTTDLELLENELEEGADSVEELLLRLEEYSLLRKALAALDPKCRTLLTELFLKDQPTAHAAIAAELNLPLGSIGPTRTRCLDKLRKEVELLYTDEVQR
jgi:RNA polymerase sigma factor (sigma-70 family)